MKRDIDPTPEMLYEYRMEKINKTTPIELEYNQYVKQYIELYAINRREEFTKILGLSKMYFPYFDEMLDKYNLPLELKYLAIIESGLNPTAVSKSGATGLWQFLLNTCQLFDLDVNSYVDERRDLFKSTEAACKYFRYLYSIFNDWQLVLSSYNGGPGEVRKAIERSKGETNYWTLRPLLSEQAQNYVPAFIAVTYLMNYYQDHDFVPENPPFIFSELDTIKLSYSLTFRQISEMINYPVDSIRFLNPVYKTDIIPELDEPSTLVLPEYKILEFLKKETQILGCIHPEANYYTTLNNSDKFVNKVRIIHIVEKGEFFHKIAMKYNCSPENIKKWNNLNDNTLNPGQKLIIWVDKDQVNQPAK